MYEEQMDFLPLLLLFSLYFNIIFIVKDRYLQFYMNVNMFNIIYFLNELIFFCESNILLYFYLLGCFQFY